ncbi:hemolysin family protein [Myceligenerans pegani]|uniref:HlyC/CorC family transporter n=1 Tax=Myceligenerans pegani TaxID=2776917 RepID=A0ABR9N2C2_9MICO|nr:hemolysin family protein [Myceligenerans sp. TRM 65318]MBE1877788.1 HlyC/CorC family transporter [Myceligenerans sp. TRM 65318]MBE3020059.1 HlyC/CorC family transporter [Myceligenerans sp. TRM 65318]
MTAGLLAFAALVGFVLAGVLSAGEAALLRVTRSGLAECLADAEHGPEPDPRRAARARSAQALVVEPTATVASFALVRVTAEVVAIAAATLLVQQAIPDPPSGDPVPELLVMLVALATGLGVGVLFVRISPRALGFRRPVQVLLALAPTLTVVSRGVARLTRLSVPRVPPSPEEDRRDMAYRVGESEDLEEEDRELLRSAIELADTIVREVMVPRTDMITVAADTPLTKVLRLFLRSGFSRVPVVGKSVDDVVGVAYLKDVAAAVHWPVDGGAGPAGARPAADVAREAVFVPESKPVDELLREMQSSASHIALVVDEYGGIAGLVTIEDLLEELVGELTDEHDTVPVQEAEELSDGEFRVPARMPVDELGELFDLRLDDDDVDTAGGLLAKALGKVPLAGSAAEVSGLHLTAERVEGRRKQLATLVVRRVSPADGDNGGEPAPSGVVGPPPDAGKPADATRPPKPGRPPKHEKEAHA